MPDEWIAVIGRIGKPTVSPYKWNERTRQYEKYIVIHPGVNHDRSAEIQEETPALQPELHAEVESQPRKPGSGKKT